MSPTGIAIFGWPRALHIGGKLRRGQIDFSRPIGCVIFTRSRVTRDDIEAEGSLRLRAIERDSVNHGLATIIRKLASFRLDLARRWESCRAGVARGVESRRSTPALRAGDAGERTRPLARRGRKSDAGGPSVRVGRGGAPGAGRGACGFGVGIGPGGLIRLPDCSSSRRSSSNRNRRSRGLWSPLTAPRPRHRQRRKRTRPKRSRTQRPNPKTRQPRMPPPHRGEPRPTIRSRS